MSLLPFSLHHPPHRAAEVVGLEVEAKTAEEVEAKAEAATTASTDLAPLQRICVSYCPWVADNGSS